MGLVWSRSCKTDGVAQGQMSRPVRSRARTVTSQRRLATLAIASLDGIEAQYQRGEAPIQFSVRLNSADILIKFPLGGVDPALIDALGCYPSSCVVSDPMVRAFRKSQLGGAP